MVTAAKALTEFRKIRNLVPWSELSQAKGYLKTLADDQPLQQRHLLQLMVFFLPLLKKWQKQEDIPAALTMFTFLTNAILSGSTSPFRHHRLELADMYALSVEQPKFYPYWLSCKAPEVTSLRVYERATDQNDRPEQRLLAQWLLAKIGLATDRYRLLIAQNPLPLHAVNHLGLLAQAGILTPATTALVFAKYPNYPLAETQLVDCLLHLKAANIYTDDSVPMLQAYLTKGLQQFADEIHIASISIGIDIDPNHLVALLSALKKLELWSLENVKHIMNNDAVLYALMRSVYANIRPWLRSLKADGQLTQAVFERIFSDVGVKALESGVPLSSGLLVRDAQDARTVTAIVQSNTFAPIKAPPGSTAESSLLSQAPKSRFPTRRESVLAPLVTIVLSY